MFLLFLSYVMARCIVDASCLCLPVAAAAISHSEGEELLGCGVVDVAGEKQEITNHSEEKNDLWRFSLAWEFL